MPGLANDLNISEPGYVTHNGSGVFHGRTFQAGTGITLTNADGIAGNTTIASTASLTDLHTARFIVASSTAGTGANFTTITAAIAAAQGTGINSTIFLQPGTYTENFTLPANINLAAYTCDALTPNVTIVGNITCSAAGTRSISGIRLQTNGAALLTVSANAAIVVNIDNCYLNCTNATGISFSSASASAKITITNCKGDLGTTGIGLFSHSSAGFLLIENSSFTNTGGSSTANTCSAGIFDSYFSRYLNPITMSSTGASTWEHCLFSTEAQNATAATLNGGSSSCKWCRFDSGTASAVSVGSSAGRMQFCSISSSNASAIAGAGSLSYSDLVFTSTSSTISVTTQVAFTTKFGIERSTLQPAFLATANLQSDVTGDATTYTILYANSIFDQNSNFNTGTGIFTAPVTGRYQFNVTTALSGLTASHTSGTVSIIATSRNIAINAFNWGAVMTAGTVVRACGSVVLDMTAADTCRINVTITGGTKVVDILATDTTFSGFLVC